MKYRFEKTIAVDGRIHKAGDEVAEPEIPAGCLESLVRQRLVVPVEPPKLAQAKPPELQTAAVKTTSKK